MSKRIYSEEEVAKLIRRAVELDSNRSGSSKSGDQSGLTMQDLEKIAADSGIDPELMHRAADELDRDDAMTDLKESTRVNRSEIVAEHWIKGELTREILDDLIIELNHRFGTSEDDINWWDRLWNDYSGKPLINRTKSSADWRYTDEMEFYTTRVLIQQRGDKLRIRVSKRQGWNLSWNTGDSHLSSGLLYLLVFTIIGSVVGFAALDSVFIGIMGGLALSALLVPLSIVISKRRLKHHMDEVSEIAENLIIQAKQLSKESASDRKTRGKSGSKSTSSHQPSTRVIEIETGSEQKSSSDKNRLRNHLRE
ncbi:hypothetical protein DYD21_11840 [Rhodohalobacter sp. SW132]|uniref:hypothetical protein n=1 Tax=Rhodohalobacter sp. SW132 TaxID=2293433 RepID=UPI000E22DD0F|nr:hypothetical protein [Rhodohalobacter sp. SW132]REL33456.1 hypothetical protein DYD21_11840 [Rhodohalobacter sp. SW132]